MGNKFCVDCCKNIPNSLSEEHEDELYTEMHKPPRSFRSDYLNNKFMFETQFLYFENVQKVDFINEENKTLQCSAILETLEIPPIPKPCL
jgi:hypothetical protein